MDVSGSKNWAKWLVVSEVSCAVIRINCNSEIFIIATN